MDFRSGGFLIGGFINLGGPPVFKLHFFGGQWWLINPGGIINPHLTLLVCVELSQKPCFLDLRVFAGVVRIFAG